MKHDLWEAGKKSILQGWSWGLLLPSLVLTCPTLCVLQLGQQFGRHTNTAELILPLPSNSIHCCCCQVASVVSDSVRPHRQQPTRLPCLWALYQLRRHDQWQKKVKQPVFIWGDPWQQPNGKKQRRTKVPLDEGERGEWKSLLKTKHSKKLRSWDPVPSLHGR